ncbi:MAG TPA: hypothetical protein VFZ66_13120 [Herpetosiphonaceae bacterium]
MRRDRLALRRFRAHLVGLGLKAMLLVDRSAFALQCLNATCPLLHDMRQLVTEQRLPRSAFGIVRSRREANLLALGVRQRAD